MGVDFVRVARRVGLRAATELRSASGFSNPLAGGRRAQATLAPIRSRRAM